jgi:hypothetical protein
MLPHVLLLRRILQRRTQLTTLITMAAVDAIDDDLLSLLPLDAGDAAMAGGMGTVTAFV